MTFASFAVFSNPFRQPNAVIGWRLTQRCEIDQFCCFNDWQLISLNSSFWLTSTVVKENVCAAVASSSRPWNRGAVAARLLRGSTRKSAMPGSPRRSVIQTKISSFEMARIKILSTKSTCGDVCLLRAVRKRARRSEEKTAAEPLRRLVPDRCDSPMQPLSKNDCGAPALAVTLSMLEWPASVNDQPYGSTSRSLLDIHPAPLVGPPIPGRLLGCRVMASCMQIHHRRNDTSLAAAWRVVIAKGDCSFARGERV